MQALKPKTNYLHASTKPKFHETSGQTERNDRPTKRPWPQGHQQYNSPNTREELKKQSSRKSQKSQTWEELKELQIKKLCAKINFSTNKMVSCYIPMETLRADLKKLKGGNITNCFEKWASITQDQFNLNIAKFELTMEFANPANPNYKI